MAILLIVFCTLIYVLINVVMYKLWVRPPNFPPGPRGVPLLGYAPLLAKKGPLFKLILNLTKKYGPVTGFYVGPTQPFICVAGPKAVKEALHNDDLDGRPCGAILMSRTFGKRLGLLFVDGDSWQEQRRFVLRHLREFCMGKTLIEKQMMNEINDLIADITATSNANPDHIVDFKGMFVVSVINILWTFLGGKRFRRDDEMFKKLSINVEQFLHGGNALKISFPIPAFILRSFPSLPRLLGISTQLFVPLQKFIKETIQQHLYTRFKGDPARDFIDVYLDQIRAELEKNSSTTFSKKQLIAIIQDLFGAGSDTSSSSIGFGILYLIHYPEIQQKLWEEINQICGDSLPSLSHRSRLPYTEAVLMEVIRLSSVAPLAVPHCALRETHLQGFTIPQGSIIAISLNSLMKDISIWGDPENFRPERHLDQEGNLIQNESYTPFGTGKRMCLGEALARNTVFLFMACLVKKFEFKPVPGEPLPTLEPIIGIVLGPKPFRAVAIPRDH
ncbi:methyl farnesoate epoxidase [Daphnia magna]|uniref:methyl farnesoate epoxidase n=1 Tax=Daphnia magna TaxID=35525 RepID=UPI0014041F5A|nr:methyl farnesoate epoxidase [Daphnia magna]